jgi:DME family drug/metabolite transporter
MKFPASRTRAPALALVVASLLWGTTGTAANYLPANVSPLAVGASTMVFGGLLLFAVSAPHSIRAVRDAASRPWIILGALGVIVYPLAFYSAMNLAGVAIGNVVSLGTGPVFAALLEWAFERRRPTRLWALCTVVAVIGVGLLAAGAQGSVVGASGGHPSAIIAGVGLGLAAGFSYALYSYASNRAIGAGSPQRGAIGGMFALGAVGLIPVLIVFGLPLIQSWATVGIAAYLAIGPMFVAYLFFGIGIGSLGASRVTTITLLEPAVATVLAVVVVGERLSVIGWLGVAVILGAIAVIATARQPAARSDGS